MLKKLNNIFFATAIVIFAFSLIISVLSYSQQDPSFNKASSSKEIVNILGYPGAYFSGLCIDILGAGTAILILFIIQNAFFLVKKNHYLSLWIRFLAFLVTLPFFSLLMYKISEIAYFDYNYGGFLGLYFYGSLLQFFSSKYIFVIFSTAAFAASIIIAFDYLNALMIFIKRIINLFIHLTLSFRNSYKISYTNHSKTKEDFAFSDTAKPHVAPVVNKSTPVIEKAIIQSKLKLEDNDYEIPSTTLLNVRIEKNRKNVVSEQALSQNSLLLSKVLEDFGINGQIVQINPGPVVTLYEFEPQAGVKSSRIIGLCEDIARSMSATSARIAVLPGKNALGIELPNSHREIVSMKELLETKVYQDADEKLPLILGKNIAGEPVVADLAKMPHLLVAGTTGSGKSVAINTMILSLLYAHTPKTCKFVMIDPKMLELSVYDGIPHLLAPVVTEAKKAVAALKWVVKEMERRYKLMSLLGVRNMEGFNKVISDLIKKGEKLEKEVQVGFDRQSGNPKYEIVPLGDEPLPFIVVIVDEMADLMVVAGKEIEGSIQRLAQMARAAGIHIIMATQRPSVDVITGVIKANFPTRISFQVTSKIDSRTILGEQGAEQLLGMGDMLFMRGGGRIERVHGPFVSDEEVEKVTQFVKSQGTPSYIETITQVDDEDSDSNLIDGDGSADDDLYRKAVAIVLKDRKASTSYVQRCLRIGYNRAAILIERMEREGIISPANHSGKREVMDGSD